MAMSATRWSIHDMGDKGDGLARDASGNRAFIPFTLPGETVNAAVSNGRGEPIAILEKSDERVAPPCPHFTDCGGCALQHWQKPAYESWKRQKLIDVLAARGIEAEVGPLVPSAEHARRRVTLSARQTESGPVLGYHAALSSRIVPIESCVIADRAIVDALPHLRQLVLLLAQDSKPFSLVVTASRTGLDIAISDLPALSGARRQAAADFTMKARFARLSLDGEILIEPQKPIVAFGAVEVTPPPGGFLQATTEAEETMAALVGDHMKGAKTIADLFAGCGTFALRLARFATVHAVEGDAPSLAGLDRGFRFGDKLKRVTTEKRDLFERPLTWKELKTFDGVVFDPPRAGAEAQCRQLAKSDVPKIAAVSCNPTTLARDLAILIEGGYRLKSVMPVDQFLWSPHLEAVALLEKPGRPRRRSLR